MTTTADADAATGSIQPLLDRLDACVAARKWAGQRTLAEAWAECPRGDWMLWLAVRLEIDRRVLVAATCAVVRPALRYIPAGEDRPRIAIEAAEAWARGEEGGTLESVRTTADAAAVHATEAEAASDAADAAAYAATKAACTAAYAAAAYAAAAYAADAACTAAAYAADAAAYAAAAAANARVASLAVSADLVRQHIPSRHIYALAAEISIEAPWG